jgi:hypothetical protein
LRHLDADGTDRELEDGSSELPLLELTPQFEKVVYYCLSPLANGSRLTATVLHSLEVPIKVGPAALKLATILEGIGFGSIHSENTCEILTQQSLSARVVLFGRDSKES